MNADNFISSSVTLPTGVEATSLTATKKESNGMSSELRVLINIAIFYVLPIFGVLIISVAVACYYKCVDAQKKNVADFGDSSVKDIENGAGVVEKAVSADVEKTQSHIGGSEMKDVESGAGNVEKHS